MSDGRCEVPESNPTSGEIVDILTRAKTVAVVGLSSNPEKDSYRVAKYLQDHGYRVIPVNPAYEEVLGEKSYASVKDVPGHVDIVDVFRKPEFIPEVVDDAIAKGAGTVWLQLGLAHNEAAKKAEAAGLKVVQNKCMKIEHHHMESDR